MFDWLKAWQIGSQILKGIRDLMAGSSTSFTVPISIHRHKFLLSVRVDPQSTTAPLVAKLVPMSAA